MERIKDDQTAKDNQDLSFRRSKRLDIQGLRGIATLLVFVMHLDPKSYRLGFVGVDIFFVLSGYLITKILLKKELSVKSMGNFYSRRFKRIAPVYMIVILLVYIYGYFYMTALDREQILRDIAWACTYTYNLQPLFHDKGYWIQLSSFVFCTHMVPWSGVQYYLIIPLVLCIASYCTHKARMLMFFLLGALFFTFQLFAAPDFSYGFLISRIWQFICGSIAYEAKSNYPEVANLDCCGWIASAVTYILVTALLAFPAISSEYVSDNAARTYATFATAIVIYFNTCISAYKSDYDLLWKSFLCFISCPLASHPCSARYCSNSQMLSITEINYAIRWITEEAKYYVHKNPCERDMDTEIYTNYTAYPDYRCIAKGNGSVSVMLVGDSVACRAYALLHDIFRGRYSKFRLFSRPGCPFLWCSEMTVTIRKIVQHEKPDVMFYMQRAYARFNAPVTELDTDFIYKQFQSNIEFFRYTKHIVIDMPYCMPAVNIGASLARKLYLGLLPGNEFVITWKQCAKQMRYQMIRLRSLKCDKCIMNDLNKVLFKEGFFRYYDPRTFLSRIADRVHMTAVGLEMLRPLYTEIIEKLLSTLLD